MSSRYNFFGATGNSWIFGFPRLMENERRRGLKFQVSSTFGKMLQTGLKKKT